MSTTVPPGFTDHIYKTTSSSPLRLRFWPSKHPSPLQSNAHPLAFFIHGGAWTHGQHLLPSDWIFQAFTKAGFHFVSVSYRFAPHVNVYGQMEDCIDAWRWCRDTLPGVLTSMGVPPLDPTRWISMGQSAGANLSMMIGHHAIPEEKPRGVFDGFGQVSFLDPQSFPLEPFVTAPRSSLTQEQVVKGAASRDERQAQSWCPYEILDLDQQTAEEKYQLSGLPYEVQEAQQHSDVINYIFNMKQLYEAVLWKNQCATEREWQERLKQYSMLSQVDANFPPTVILHGEEDEVVDVERTREFERRLRGLGVEVKGYYVPGARHACDQGWETASPEIRERYIDPIVEFCVKAVCEELA